MPESPPPITSDDVRHVAELARLSMSEAEIQACQADLTSILGHIATINAVDVSGTDPLAHAIDMSNRLSEDVVEQSLPIDDVLGNAPAIEDRFIAVPKVLETGDNA